jgi:UDP-N-acetylmuramyl pentapeptide phosphotransferase/UDP-N-acetylglucosamine-1-phosphate transferase
MTLLHLVSFASALVLSAGAIVLLRPVLQRYALARPNTRSSHVLPTPQGGGIAVVGATLLVTAAAFVAGGAGAAGPASQLAALIAAALVLAVAGAIDDISSLHPLPRFGLQIASVAVVLALLPPDLRIVPVLPWWLERAAMLIAAVWFVNLVNFMDGIDWMTVAEVLPVSAGLVLCGLLGGLPPLGVLTACALAGAILGFAPFNRPVARLFLGDVGSVPIGLILAWLLILLAGSGHLAAALLLPLYYLADASITLARRLVRGEKVWQAHRTHFYQRATDNGLSVPAIVARVFVTNVALVALAVATVWHPGPAISTAALAIGVALVAALLWHFSRGRR